MGTDIRAITMSTLRDAFVIENTRAEHGHSHEHVHGKEEKKGSEEKHGHSHDHRYACDEQRNYSFV